MCLRETSLTAQRPNLSISILPSLLPCLTGFPPASQWEWLLQQNKQKNTQIYIKTSPDVPRCSPAASQGMVFSSRRNLSCNQQPFTTDSWESFTSFTCNLFSSRDLHEKVEVNIELHEEMHDLEYQRVSLEYNNFGHGKKWNPFL